MTIQEAFIRFKEGVNRNLKNDDVSTDRGRFILLLNEAQDRYMSWMLEKRHEDDIRYVERMLKNDLELSKSGMVLDHCDFEIPDDFYDLVNLQVYATSGKCRARLKVFENKSEDIERFCGDPFQKPSFKARETYYTLGDGKIKIYTDGFEVDKVYLTYYKYPRRVDIEGYINIDGDYSQDIHPEWDDRNMYRILRIAVHLHNYNLTENVQIDRAMIFSDL